MRFLHTPDGKVFNLDHIEYIDCQYTDHVHKDGVMIRTQSGFQIAWQGEHADIIRARLLELK